MTIYTIGFTQKSAEQFFEAIKKNNIELLIDVRLNNKSQLAGFSKGNTSTVMNMPRLKSCFPPIRRALFRGTNMSRLLTPSWKNVESAKHFSRDLVPLSACACFAANLRLSIAIAALLPKRFSVPMPI